MKVCEKINLFVEDKKKKNGEIVRVFKTNISTKKENSDEYIRLYKDVVFSSKTFPAALLNKLDPAKVYEMNITDGWLNVREYVDRNGNRHVVDYIFVNGAKLTGAKAIDQEKRQKALEARENAKAEGNDDLPF